MKKLLLLTLLLAVIVPVSAQDTTLRLDYIFSGTAEQQTIALDEALAIPGWYGKRQRMDEVPMQGNGQIRLETMEGRVVYRNSFSTLFQEWLTYPEAKTTSRSFENVFLVPMPTEKVRVTVELYNNRREVAVSMTHEVDPNDILIRRPPVNVAPRVTLQQADDTTRCINIAFIAEGYQESEMDVFVRDAQEATDAIFAHEPFKSSRSKFNVVAVKAPSKESGTSEPAKGQWRNTALGSHFDTFYSSRYLTTLRLKDLHNLLAGAPYEHIIVLVNTEQYGGGGILNSYNLSMTHHQAFRPVVVHEFGHSFAGLADEYAYEAEPLELYPLDVEPWEENITTMVDFDSKWKDMIGGEVSVYEGAGYAVKGIYRPVPECRMRVNSTPDFCPVCQRALQRVIDFYTK